jgi:hypothetical protein
LSSLTFIFIKYFIISMMACPVDENGKLLLPQLVLSLLSNMFALSRHACHMLVIVVEARLVLVYVLAIVVEARYKSSSLGRL